LVVLLGLALRFAVFAFALGRLYVGQALPFHEADRLVFVRIVDSGGRVNGLSQSHSTPFPSGRVFRGRSRLPFGETLRLRLPTRSVALITMAVTPNLFDVLGVRADVTSHWQEFSRDSGTLPLLLSARANSQLGLQQGQILPAQSGAKVVIGGTLDSRFVFPRLTTRYGLSTHLCRRINNGQTDRHRPHSPESRVVHVHCVAAF
jgi:hypothetical protein